MRPQVFDGAGRGRFGEIVVLVVKRDAGPIAAQFRHLVRKTQDPAERYEAALRLLAAAYYQRPGEFADELTALFGPDSTLVAKLLEPGRCVLEFEQYRQRYRLPCAVRELGEPEPAYQATYWHNHLFNPAMPGGGRILGFAPDWAGAQADPPVG